MPSPKESVGKNLEFKTKYPKCTAFAVVLKGRGLGDNGKD